MQKVFGVGGGGNNIINTMTEFDINNVEFISIIGYEFLAERSLASKKISIDPNFRGRGQVMPVGYAAEAEKKRDEIAGAIEGADVVYIVACMGGAVGNGASPVIAKIAGEMGVKAIAIVTKPFRFEGVHRARRAEEGVIALRDFADELYILSLEDVLSEDASTQVINIKDDSASPIIISINWRKGAETTMLEAFDYANDAICQCVQQLTKRL